MLVLKRLVKMMKPYRTKVILGIILASLTIASNLGLLITSAYLISWAALAPHVMELMVLVAGVRFFGISRGVFRYGERYLTHNAAFSILGEIRVNLYQSLERLSPGQLSSLHSGQLLTNLAENVDNLKEVYLRIFLPPIIAFIIFLGTALFLSYFHWSLVLIFVFFYFLATIGLKSLDYFIYSGKERLIHEKEKLNILLLDSIQGLPEILIFGRKKDYEKKTLGEGSQFILTQWDFAKKNTFSNSLLQLITNLAMFTALLISIPLVNSGKLNGIWLAALVLGVQGSFEGTEGLAQLIPNFKESLTAGKKIFAMEELMGEQLAKNQGIEAKNFFPVNYDLKIKDLSFTYPKSSTPAIEKISFTLPKGGSLAILGSIGSGKSTIAQLLLKFWPYEKGSIKLGDQELNTLSESQLWQNIALVSREDYLFNTSLKENLLLAKPEATEEELLIALDKVNFLPHLELLPAGLETILGEDAWRLSGGQRQLVSLARSLLKNPSILILDEATEGLDPISEQQILAAIENLMEDYSIIMITHRLAHAKKMGKIIFLKDGRIIERGSHEELLAQQGNYYNYFQLFKKDL